MRIFAMLFVLCLIFGGCKKEEDNISSWMSTYYIQPSPNSVPEKIL